MKLSPLEQKILGTLSLRADASLSELSKETGAKIHSCRYALHGLFNKGLLTRRVVINSLVLGYSVYALWFAPHPRARKNATAVRSYFERSNVVGYFGEHTGQYRYRLDIYTKSTHELRQFFSDISRDLGDVFMSKELAAVYSISDYPLKYLSPHRTTWECCRIEAATDVVDIDETDHKILKALSTIDSASHTSIARSLKMPLATFEYRVKRLRERKVIIGYHVWPHVDKLEVLGFKTCVYRIKLSNLSVESRAKVDQFALQEPTVFSCTHYAGHYDVEICSSTNSPEVQDAFMRNLETALGSDIASMVTNPVIRHYKVSNYPM